MYEDNSFEFPMINFHYLCEHTGFCKIESERVLQKRKEKNHSWGALLLTCNEKPKDYFVFQYKFKFHVVLFYECQAGFNRTGLIKTIMEGITDNYKLWDTMRWEKLNTRILSDMSQSFYLKEKVPEINYMYSNNAAQSFAYVTYHEYLDAILSCLNGYDSFTASEYFHSLSHKTNAEIHKHIEGYEDVKAKIRNLKGSNEHLQLDYGKFNYPTYTSINQLISSIKKTANEVY